MHLKREAGRLMDFYHPPNDLKRNSDMDFTDVIWIAVLFFFGIPFIGMPLVIRFKQAVSRRPETTVTTLWDLPLEVRDYFTTASTRIQGLDFEEAVYIHLSELAPNISADFTIHPGSRRGDMAGTFVFWKEEAGDKELAAQYVEFSTRFNNGRIIITNNNPQLAAYPEIPEKTVYSFPEIADPQKLYRLHGLLLDREPGRTGKAASPSPDRIIEHLNEYFRKEGDRKVEMGLLYVDAARDAYRPTIKGAYLMTWSLLWPVTSIRRALINRRARVLMHELVKGAII